MALPEGFYFVVSVEYEDQVKDYFKMWNGSSWGLHRSVTVDGDPFAGSGYGEGSQYNYTDIGPGTDTVAVYSCNKPFALRLNDRSADEFVYQGHHMRNPIWMGLPVR